MNRATVTGRLSTHRDGYGFVIPDEGGDDVFIPARYLRDNMHGDRVVVRIQPRGTSGRREGRVVETLERGFTTIVGRFESTGDDGLVIPDEPRLSIPISIPAAARLKARPGQMVVAEITDYPSGRRGASGRIIEVLGSQDDPDVEFLTIVRKYGLPDLFPPEVLAEAASVYRPVGDSDREGRVDLRDLLTVTIDGETARDFDDAVSVRRERDDSIRLWVSIADVSHYVAPGSCLDREALKRGTSVYFPDRCIPMLPEKLSNGICSLNPREDRLAMTAELLFDAAGEARESSFYPSVIRSDERLTYTEVKEILADKNPETIQRHAGLCKDLRTMEVLAGRLGERRRQRGSIDFDLPEPEIILDLQGRPESIGIAERNLAHRLIEEFMLAANEAVAAHLEGNGIPCIFRVHEPPDPLKLKDFQEFIKPMGLSFKLRGDSVAPGEFQRLLGEVEGRPEERMVNELLLRCMKQARYSAENLGHFGLASPCYLHFTSPIRRYPDLVTHRILKEQLSGRLQKRQRGKLAADLPEVAEQSSQRERKAMEAEREIIDLKRLQYMEKHLGEVYDACITGVTSFGIFVELPDLVVEGLVHVSALGNELFQLLEKQHTLLGKKSGISFRIGDRVRVRADAVNRSNKRIEFSLESGGRKLSPGVRLEKESSRVKNTSGKRDRKGTKGKLPRRGGKRR
ncbi:MAG: ribonuclease R [Deltaproteobacteria bacterium]|nr:ribonuclease R [Deltaproteobacteria bacterium]TLN02282.1 MAG: ribonuclease R [bacterium]